MRRGLLDRPGISVGIFTLTWATMELIVPAAGVSPYQIVWTRYGVHLLVLALLVGRRRGFALVRTAQPTREILSSLLMLGMPLCFVWAAQRMPVRDTMAVFWTAPVLVVAIAAARGRQFGGVRTVAAAIVGLTGAMLIYRPDAGIFRPASLLALGMAGCFALYVVTVGSIRGDAIPTKLFHTAFWVFAVLTLDLPRFWNAPTGREIAVMATIGVLGCGGLYALDRALEVTRAAVLAPVLYTQLAWDIFLHVVLRWRLHAAWPDGPTLLGFVLVLAAAAPVLGWRVRDAGVVREASA